MSATAYVRTGADGQARLNLMVENIRCGGCVARIERELAAIPGLEARVNLSTRRLAAQWRGGPELADQVTGALTRMGFPATPYDPERLGQMDDAEERQLLQAMAVAGFAAANVMLLSVAVWAGQFQDMDPSTRGLLHWFSALIALPAVLWAGRPFLRSAARALRAGQMNMDVPISLAVLLASAVSLWQTIEGGAHAWFDSAVTLLFFLLIGRWLDRRARGRACQAAERLMALGARAVTVLRPDGGADSLPPDAVRPGMMVHLAAGERAGVDGILQEGRTELDCSLITGESKPRTAGPGDAVLAGAVNLSAPVRLTVTAAGDNTLLAGIVRLMEAAEQKKARHVVLADKVARFYAPLVHGLALAAFLFWWLAMGMAWTDALLIAISVLIITCPCALALAVPAVQVIAAGRLMRRGILLKSATALERLAQCDHLVFDKTGTLTLGRPRPVAPDAGALAAAGPLAAASTHPLARALARAAGNPAPAAGVTEHPGKGLALDAARLGSRAFCGLPGAATGSEICFTRPGHEPVVFAFADGPRADAAATIAALAGQGFGVEILSGDAAPAVAEIASATGIADWRAGANPADKLARLAELAAAGRKVLMVGDGLNDAPALAAAHASLSPASAADIAQTAADCVFQGEALAPVAELLAVAAKAARLVRQNFAAAFAFNAIMVPLAMAGQVTPLVAALAMSSSSLLVVGNALRLAGRR